MKLKYYLRGLGTGILFATIILFISYTYRMSDKQIKERAFELGMVYPDKESVTSEEKTTKSDEATSKDIVESTETTSKKDEETQSATEIETTAKEETTKEETTKEETTKEETTVEQTTQESTTKEPQTEETTTKNNKPAKSYVLTVTSRTISMDVANKLENAGIIDDADDFNDYLCENGYASNIQNGKFTITSDMSYKEIAETITRRPKN